MTRTTDALGSFTLSLAAVAHFSEPISAASLLLLSGLFLGIPRVISVVQSQRDGGAE